MVFRFAYLDIIPDTFCYDPIEDDEKLTLLSMPLYAIFTKQTMFLPIRYEAVDILLRMPTQSLHNVGLRKGELWAARNEFLRFESEEELYLLPDSEASGSKCGDPFTFFNARATSGGI